MQVDDADRFHPAHAAANRRLIETDDVANAAGGNPRLGRQQGHDPPIGDADAELRAIGRRRRIRYFAGQIGQVGRNIIVEIEGMRGNARVVGSGGAGAPRFGTEAHGSLQSRDAGGRMPARPMPSDRNTASLTKIKSTEPAKCHILVDMSTRGPGHHSMKALRHWSVRHASALKRVYDAGARLALHLRRPLQWLGAHRMERVLRPLERATKQLLVDCKMCGQCVLSSTGMACPTNCAKQMRNGPCGGVRADGTCEVDPAHALRLDRGDRRTRSGSAGRATRPFSNRSITAFGTVRHGCG